MSAKLTQTNVFIMNLLPTITYIMLKTNLIICYLKKRVSTNFSLLHINARSLSKNKDHLSLYLSTLKIKFGVIAVTETWASADNEALLSISGYNSVFKNRLQNGAMALHCVLEIHLTLLNVKIWMHFLVMTLNRFL